MSSDPETYFDDIKKLQSEVFESIRVDGGLLNEFAAYKRFKQSNYFNNFIGNLKTKFPDFKEYVAYHALIGSTPFFAEFTKLDFADAQYSVKQMLIKIRDNPNLVLRPSQLGSLPVDKPSEP